MDAVRDMEKRLCPRCGAYWDCGCPPQALTSAAADDTCPHDWFEPLAVDMDEDLPEEARVLACRLCGRFALADLHEGRRIV